MRASPKARMTWQPIPCSWTPRPMITTWRLVRPASTRVTRTTSPQPTSRAMSVPRERVPISALMSMQSGVIATLCFAALRRRTHRRPNVARSVAPTKPLRPACPCVGGALAPHA